MTDLYAYARMAHIPCSQWPELLKKFLVIESAHLEEEHKEQEEEKQKKVQASPSK